MASSFHLKIPQINKLGPICSIVLKPSCPAIKTLKLQKKQVPVIKVRALIDTGASHTAISHNVIKRLKLVPRGTVQVHTSHRKAEIRNEYDVSLKFDNVGRQKNSNGFDDIFDLGPLTSMWRPEKQKSDAEPYIEVLRVLEANLPDQRIDCLIGRDVLQYCVFTYDGRKKEIKLKF